MSHKIKNNISKRELIEELVRCTKDPVYFLETYR